MVGVRIKATPTVSELLEEEVEVGTVVEPLKTEVMDKITLAAVEAGRADTKQGKKAETVGVESL